MSWRLKILPQRAGGNPGTVGTQADSERFSFYSTYFRSYLAKNSFWEHLNSGLRT